MPPGRHFAMRARRADAAALAALALAVYANTLHADFTFDDQFAVVSNADVLDGARGSATASPPFPSDPSTAEWDDRPARRASSLWRNDYWGQNLTSDASHKSWRPLTVLTFRLNAAIGGLEPSPPTIPTPHPDDGTAPHHPPRPRPFGFHALNVILHALAVLLSHRLLLRLAPALLPDRHPDARRAFAWFAAALLAAHPVRSEAVASVVGRADVLAAALATLAILAHADRKPWLAAAATGAAALCKETGVTVLAPLAAWDLAGLPGPDRGRAEAGDSSRGGRDGGSSSPIRSSSSTFSSSPLGILTRLAPPTFAIGVYLAARRAATGASTLVRIYREVENPLAFSDDAYSRRLSLAHLHATYAWLTAWPARLSCDWSHACVEPITSAYDARALLAAAAYAASATALIRGAVGASGTRRIPRPRARVGLDRQRRAARPRVQRLLLRRHVRRRAASLRSGARRVRPPRRGRHPNRHGRHALWNSRVERVERVGLFPVRTPRVQVASRAVARGGVRVVGSRGVDVRVRSRVRSKRRVVHGRFALRRRRARMSSKRQGTT